MSRLFIIGLFALNASVHASEITNFYLRNFLIASQQVQVTVWNCPSNYLGPQSYISDLSAGGTNGPILFQPLSDSRIGILARIEPKYTNRFALFTNGTAAVSNNTFNFITALTNSDANGTWKYRFTNGWCGFDVVNPIAANSNLFAIQGLILRNGEIVCQTNLMYDNQDNHAFPADGIRRLGTNAINITNRTVELVDIGPLRVYVKVRDEYSRPAWSYLTNSQPAGFGYFETYILFEATSRSIVVHHDNNGQVVYAFELPATYRSAGAQWRYRQQRLDTSGETGYLWGQATNYPSSMDGVYWDFYRDINLAKEIVPYFGGMTEFNAVGGPINAYGVGEWWMGYHSQYGGQQSYRPVYTSFGNTNNGTSSNIIGFFEGPISWTGTVGWEPVKYVTAQEGSHIACYFFTNAPRTAKTNTGIVFHSNHVTETLATNLHHRYAYGIYLGGTNGTWINSSNAYFTDIEKDYCLYSYIPARKMLVEYGVLDGEVGAKGNYGRMFGNTITGIVARLRAGSDIDALISGLTGDSALYNMWNDPTGVQTTNLATNVLYNLTGNAFLEPLLAAGGGLSTFAHIQWGHGPYTSEMVGLQGLTRLQLFMTRIDQVLGDSTLLNGFQAWELRSAANLCARMQFDQDWKAYPTNLQSLLTGGGNFQLQEIGARNVAALYATNLASLDYARSGISNEASSVFLETAQDDGTTGGSVSYLGTVTGPSLTTFMQLKANGQDVMLSPGIAPTITNHCEYLLALDSGIDTRSSFGTYIVFGDATTERLGHAGSWATLISEYAPGLYQRMIRKMWQDGHLLNTFNVEPVLWLDIDAPTNSQPIAKSRFATGTGALFHFNTEATNNAHIMFQSDGWGVNQSSGHGYDDAGVAFIYGYGAPISIQPHAYGISPYAGWPQTRPMAMRTNSWPTWNDPTADSTLGTANSGYTALSAVHANTLFFSYSGNADTMVTNAAGKFWFRQFSPIAVSPNFQIYQYDDQFDPADTNLIQHALYATNDVAGDLGTLIPPERNMSASEAPRAGTNVSFTPGLKVLTLTGTPLAAHPAGGLDFQLALLNTSPSNTLNVYTVSHDVTSHEEQIYVHWDVTNGTSRSWIVARPKGVTAPTLSTNAEGRLSAVLGTETLNLSSTNYDYTLAVTTVAAAATFDGKTHIATNGISITGPAELRINRGANTNFSLSLSGPCGVRTITNSSMAYPIVCAASGANVTRYASR